MPGATPIAFPRWRRLPLLRPVIVMPAEHRPGDRETRCWTCRRSRRQAPARAPVPRERPVGRAAPCSGHSTRSARSRGSGRPSDTRRECHLADRTHVADPTEPHSRSRARQRRGCRSAGAASHRTRTTGSGTPPCVLGPRPTRTCSPTAAALALAGPAGRPYARRAGIDRRRATGRDEPCAAAARALPATAWSARNALRPDPGRTRPRDRSAGSRGTDARSLGGPGPADRYPHDRRAGGGRPRGATRSRVR